MEGRKTTTPICSPHICRVLLGTAGTLGFCGVLWGTMEVLWGTVATAGYWRYCGGLVVWGYLGVNRVVVDNLGYCRVLCGTVGVLHGTAGYSYLLLGTGVH